MGVFINDEVIDNIKDSGNIVDLISEYVELKKTGSSYQGLCPFHNEKTPSFSVSEEGQFFKCFGCGEGGDIINFIMKIENLEFVEAIKFLADKYGIVLRGQNIDERKLKRKELFINMNIDAARFFFKNLDKTNYAKKYLVDRNIKKRIRNVFGLGYAMDSWDSLYKFLKEKGYSDEDIEANGLIVKRKDNLGYYDRFRNRLIFPIIDGRQNVIGFGGRVLDDSMPKYLNSKDSLLFDKGKNLYGLNLIKKFSDRKRIILVEGYMDVISLFKNGIKESVASLGTSLTESQAQILKRHGKDVYICYDSDKAGIKATLRSIDILKKINVRPKIILLPNKQDPDDYITEHGKYAFEEKIKEAYNYIDFEILQLKNKYNLENVEELVVFTIEVAKIIKDIESPVEQDIYIKKISKETKVSENAIKKEIVRLNKLDKKVKRGYNSYNKRKKQNFKNELGIKDRLYEKTNKSNESEKQFIEKTLRKVQGSLLKLMFYSKEYYEYVMDKLEIHDFSKRYIGVLSILEVEYMDKDFINLDDLINKPNIGDREKVILKSLIEENINWNQDNMDKFLEDLVDSLRLNKLNQRRLEIVSSIENFEKKEDKSLEDLELFKNLCVELTEINGEIKLIRDN